MEGVKNLSKVADSICVMAAKMYQTCPDWCIIVSIMSIIPIHNGLRAVLRLLMIPMKNDGLIC